MAGAAAVVTGVGMMFDINEAAPVAEALQQVAQQSNWFGALIAVFGALSIYIREKGEKK